ncbi:DUF1697 domain-containing protein [Paraburkholderia phymatum]|uniref:DUF1697 domain-containing protein n=1 Tax=Paraburkholderia phymatum (strain DSM 17167 / CIP 108236 / LMG 21445 / STM815) TaxID=391038 RepID=B2JS95_PARP8|nr:DUF1697 domain-containing protein [Paraburkholderia phymatum]ACC72472.1 protein of unknown function DUF1697 [Paraburkholderia phymatum STM815]
MTTYVALLRAVNVGGTGKLPMTELRSVCAAAGFTNVRTYIASGNVVFDSTLAKRAVQQALESRLEAYAGKAVGVLIRTGKEIAAVLQANPFSNEAANRTVAIFLDDAPPADTLEHITGRRNEQVALGKHEIYVHYGDGMAKTKLRIPAAKNGTARNINTIAKLAQWAAQS